MKKVLYSVLALAGLLTLSCAKEIDAPNAEFAQENLVPLTLTASYDVATKVTYEGLKTFGWVANDSIKVRIANPDKTKYGWFSFGAKSTAVSSEFVGDVPDTFRPEDYAFYPGFKANSLVNVSSKSTAVRLPITYYLDEVDSNDQPIAPHIDPANCTKVYVSSANPLQFLPSVGKKQEDGSFKFQAAYGVLNIQMTDLDDEACGIKLVGTGEAYMGNLLFLDRDDQCYKIGSKYTDSDGTIRSTTYLTYWFYPKADHSASIYLPVPVGTLPAGCSIDIVNEKGEVLFRKMFAKDVEVQRGKITTLAPFKAQSDLTLLGNAKYIDTFINGRFKFASAFTEVEIYSDKGNTMHYRLVNPYPVIAAANSYTIPEGITADPYLDLYVKADGSVEYAPGYTTINTGLDAATAFGDGTGNLQMVYPNYFVGTTVDRNLVIKYDSEGKPAVLQLDPIFKNTESSYWSWFAGGTKEANNIIQILFPGQTESYDLSATIVAGDVNTDDVNNMYANASVVLGADIVSATVVMAQSATEAATAIAGGAGVVVTTSGVATVPIPSDTPSGKYSLYAKTTVADGLNPNAGQLLATVEFNFFNPGDDKGYTIADVCGNWNAANSQIYQSGWSKYAIKMTIAENTADPTLGDVVITSFFPEYFSGSNWTQLSGLYAWFDTKTGILSVDVPQAGWSHKNYPDEVCSLANYTDQTTRVVFVLEDKTTLNFTSDSIAIIGAWNSTTWAFAGYWTYMQKLNFTKIVEESSVSAAAPRVYVHFPSRKAGKVSFSSAASGVQSMTAVR